MVKASLNVAGWDAWVTQVVACTPSWPTHKIKAEDKSRHSNMQEVLNIWEVHDRELQSMPIETIRSLQGCFHEVTCLLLGKSGLLLLRLLCAMLVVLKRPVTS